MRILIIHDRPEMADPLEAIAREALGVAVAVDVAGDVLSARDLLMRSYYDLAVIDLTLPIRRGKGEATLENAEHLLDEIFDGDAKAPGDVLGISLEANVLESVRTSIGSHLMACLQEDREGHWRDVFRAKLAYLSKARRARQLVFNSSQDVDAVIVTALDKEAAPYAGFLELSDCDEFARAKEFVFRSADGRMRRGILYAIGQSGQAPSGSATQALLSQFRPRVMLMTGFCGGIAARASLGDLIAFRSSHAWDYGKWVEEKDEEGETKSHLQARPTAINVNDHGLTEVVRDLIAAAPKHDPLLVAALIGASGGEVSTWRIRQAGAASGSAVVTSLEKLGQIVALDENIWAVDMESYAFYFACRNTPVVTPDFMCIKAVADHCNGEKSSRYHDVCSSISARFALDMITKSYDFGAG